MQFIVLAILTINIILILLFVAHKVRRIHQMSYVILDHAQVARTEAEAVYSQVQAYLALDKILTPSKPLPPMRGWAGSPDFLLVIAQHILEQKPATVVECSSGVSTVVSARCMQINGAGHVYSLEHDSVYAQKTRDLIEYHGLTDWATVIDAPLVSVAGNGTPRYSLNNFPEKISEIDVLIVDGPPAASSVLARYPALPKLISRMARNATIFLDDANRPDEKLIVQRWVEENIDFEANHIYCEKGLTVLQRRQT